jgi:hypothetical protein
MSEKTSRAALRIASAEHSIKFIISALEIEPTDQKNKMEVEAGVKGYGCNESLWIYESPLDERKELSEHIDFVLKILESREEAWLAIRRRISSADIFCMFSSDCGQGSVTLRANLVQRLARQKIDLIIDLYPPEANDVES